MENEHRKTTRMIAQKYLDADDPLGWFEELYSQADKDLSIIPWADLIPNPNLVNWLNHNRLKKFGLALKIGSGLGDDAEKLVQNGFTTTAFDISESAIELSRLRFPNSSVE